MSSSAIGEDHVLVGGRITAGSAVSKEFAPPASLPSRKTTSHVTGSVENYAETIGTHTLLNSDAVSAVKGKA